MCVTVFSVHFQVRNIPNKYQQQMLLDEINVSHEGTYDFFYLPIDFKNKCNVGYCFINFLEPRFIIPFVKEFNGQRWKSFNSEKVCAITFARIQGKASMVSRFQNSSLLEKDDEYRPLLFHSSGPDRGKPEPFPVNSAKDRDRAPQYAQSQSQVQPQTQTQSQTQEAQSQAPQQTQAPAQPQSQTQTQQQSQPQSESALTAVQTAVHKNVVLQAHQLELHHELPPAPVAVDAADTADAEGASSGGNADAAAPGHSCSEDSAAAPSHSTSPAPPPPPPPPPSETARD
jgi:hypothetical protein